MVIWIPVIAAVQYVFTLASAILDLRGQRLLPRPRQRGRAHAAAVVVPLARAVQPPGRSADCRVVQENPIIGTLAGLNPFAVLFEAYRAVIYGGPDGVCPPHPPDLVSLLILLAGSVVFLGLCVVFFKRVEPEFAKVL